MCTTTTQAELTGNHGEPIATGKHVDCFKCGGTGFLGWCAHVDNGRCWACHATGRLEAGKAVGRDGVFTFTTEAGLVWQFMTIHHGDLDPDYDGYCGSHITADPKTHRIDSVTFQAFKLGAHRRKGETIIHARVYTEEARNVWAFAKAGGNPNELTAGFLGIEEPSCSIRRHQRGVNVM